MFPVTEVTRQGNNPPPEPTDYSAREARPDSSPVSAPPPLPDRSAVSSAATSTATATATPRDTRRRRLNLALLTAVNLLPLAGVLFFDWDVGALVVLYWSENLVIGFYNILKMVSLKGIHAVFPGLFFIIHYGGFCAVHGLFIISLLLEQPAAFGEDPPWPLFLVFIQLLLDVIEQVLAQAPREWLVAFVGLFISHGYSFVSNFLVARERERASMRGLMKAPYQRIILLHVAVIAGGFGVIALGQPLVLLLVLVGLKLAVDIALHRREHAAGAAR